MKYLFLTSLLMFCLSCGSQQTAHKHETHSEESHEAHNHEDHEHEAHNHEAHNHEDHDHEAHNHEDHEHEAHNHEAHNHEDHDHEAHNHEDHDHEHSADLQEEASEHNHANGITFNSAQASKLDFQVSKASRHNFKNVIKVSGKIADAQGSEAVGVATVSGVVTFDNLRLTDGKYVQKGQTLASISSQDMTDENLSTRIAEAKSNLTLATQKLDRAKELSGDIVSKKELETLQTAYEQAKLAYDNLTKGVTKNGKAVVAPISGYIKKLYVKEGQYVSVGEPVFEVSKNQRIQLTAEVPLRDYDKIKGNLSAKFNTFNSDKVYDLEELNGKVISIGKNAVNNFYVHITFEFDNKIDVLAGSFVEISVLSDQGECEEIVVPLTSLVEEQGAYSVYVKICDETYEKRHVVIGNNDSQDVVIIDGLNEGEEFVSKGAYFVKLASMSNVVPHAHNHSH